jgi:hypothetical protein
MALTGGESIAPVWCETEMRRRPERSQADSGRGGSRGAWPGRLVVLAVVLAMVSLVLSYAGRVVLDRQQFADRVVATLKSPAVRDDVADHLASAAVRYGGQDLVGVQPVIRAMAGTIVSSGAFQSLFRRAVLEIHSTMVQGRPGPILVNVSDSGVLLQAALERLAPQVAARLGAKRTARLGELRPGGVVLTVIHTARRVETIAWVLALLALIAAVVALWLAEARRALLERLGIGLAVGGVAIAAAYVIGGAVASQLAVAGRGAVVAAVWRGFAHGLLVEALVVAGAGVVLAAVASATERAPGVDGWRDATQRAHVARALLAVVAGVAIVLEPEATLTVLVTVAGLVLVGAGVRVLVQAAHASAAGARDRGRRVTGALLRASGPSLAGAAVVAATVLLVTGAGDGKAVVTPSSCDGAPALCDRPLQDVALAATHNSMGSTTIKSWLFAQQDGTIRNQLDDGIRGLLIDSYYGFAVKDGVRTDLTSLPKRGVAVKEIGEDAVAAAERIRARLGTSDLGPRQIFLCHGFCELGAITLSSALTDLHSFLVTHPDAVVVIINQDEGVAPADIEEAFERAGLLEFVYRGPLTSFPTLRSMIDSGQRLVVLAENDAGDSPWYRLAYAQALQETPFRFTDAEELTEPSRLAESCRANRGPATAPLFLLNHWIDTSPLPRPSLAAQVNSRVALLRRAETCERIRHHALNLVAVDFYLQGDVLGAVNALNNAR